MAHRPATLGLQPPSTIRLHACTHACVLTSPLSSACGSATLGLTLCTTGTGNNRVVRSSTPTPLFTGPITGPRRSPTLKALGTGLNALGAAFCFPTVGSFGDEHTPSGAQRWTAEMSHVISVREAPGRAVKISTPVSVARKVCSDYMCVCVCVCECVCVRACACACACMHSCIHT